MEEPAVLTCPARSPRDPGGALQASAGTRLPCFPFREEPILPLGRATHLVVMLCKDGVTPRPYGPPVLPSALFRSAGCSILTAPLEPARELSCQHRDLGSARLGRAVACSARNACFVDM